MVLGGQLIDVDRTDIKTAVVFGGTGALGTEITATLLRAGCTTVSVSRKATQSRHPIADLDSCLGCWRTADADVTDDDSIRRFFADFGEARKRLDFMVYSVGNEPDPDTPLLDLSLRYWQETFTTHVTGLFICFSEAMQYLTPGGHIMVVSSAITRFRDGELPHRIFAGEYAAAIAAVDEFCKWARRESHDKRVMLSRIALGAMDCAFHRNSPAYRRPPALLSPTDVATRMVAALLNNQELDESLVAKPMASH